jgi:predicted subunit of tRNA(5-methylaminomethyl-2-thiouridylate) methyltransferase
LFDAFPFDEWGDDIAEFWTFGGEGSTGTWIMTALGFSVMLVAFIGFVVLENRKLARQAAMLKASGALERPAVVVTTVITSD